MAADIKLHSASGGSVTLVPDDSLTTDETVIVQDPIGVNQTWQDKTADRVFGQLYINDTGRPIMVAISIRADVGVMLDVSMNIDGVDIGGLADYNTDSIRLLNASFIVSNGSQYVVEQWGSSETIKYWAELRS